MSWLGQPDLAGSNFLGNSGPHLPLALAYSQRQMLSASAECYREINFPIGPTAARHTNSVSSSVRKLSLPGNCSCCKKNSRLLVIARKCMCGPCHRGSEGTGSHPTFYNLQRLQICRSANPSLTPIMWHLEFRYIVALRSHPFSRLLARKLKMSFLL